jgi:hypothetical protein
MAEKRNIEVIIGEKADENRIDKSKGGQSSARPPAAEVSGRWHGATVVCPHCGVYCNVTESDVHYEWYRCWNCGLPFYA